jgi:hypothetical protein
MKPYFPDLTELVYGPMRRARLSSALAFALAYLDDFTPRPLGRKFIDKQIGASNEQPGLWLRQQLLTCSDDTYYFEVGNRKAGQTKQYILNRDGAELIKSLLGLSLIHI